MLNLLAFLLALSSIQPPLPYFNSVPLNQRLMPNFHGHRCSGRDVYSLIAHQPWLFWRNIGETPQSFLQLVADVYPALFRLTTLGQPRIRQRRQQISIAIQVLLVMMWLRKYLHVENLALWFNINPSSVVRIINRSLPEPWRYFENQIRWPNVLEWTNLMGNWPEFPNSVGAIDSTSHETYRPLTEPQILYYSGHLHIHSFAY